MSVPRLSGWANCRFQSEFDNTSRFVFFFFRRAYYRQFSWVEDWKVGSCGVPACVITGEFHVKSCVKSYVKLCMHNVLHELKHGSVRTQRPAW